MNAAARSVLVRAKVLGISLALGKAPDGSDCILWRGPKGSMTAELRADLVGRKDDLVVHLRDERKLEILAEFAAAYDRVGRTYPDADDAGLAEVARQFPDLFTGVEKLEFEADAAAGAYRDGHGSLQGYVFALAAWERGVLDAVAALANVRSGRLCNDCGSETPVTVMTGLAQRICSTCARADAATRRACPPRRLPP